MFKKIIKYNPTNEEFLIWFTVKHRILYRIFRNRCASDLINGKITITDATDEQKELANLLIKKDKIDKEINKKKRDLKK